MTVLIGEWACLIFSDLICYSSCSCDNNFQQSKQLKKGRVCFGLEIESIGKVTERLGDRDRDREGRVTENVTENTMMTDKEGRVTGAWGSQPYCFYSLNSHNNQFLNCIIIVCETMLLNCFSPSTHYLGSKDWTQITNFAQKILHTEPPHQTYFLLLFSLRPQPMTLCQLHSVWVFPLHSIKKLSHRHTQ